MTNDILKLKVSLCEVIRKWMEDQSESEGWNEHDTPVSDLTCELMTDSAFNILHAQRDLNVYMFQEGMLKEN